VALGAADYVLKGSPREDLIGTIVAAAAGESPSRHGELKKIAGTMKVRQVLDDDVPLTQRETQVLRHVALGLSNREIGKSLEISVETVKEHVQNILRKIAVSDRTSGSVGRAQGLGVRSYLPSPFGRGAGGEGRENKHPE